MSKPAKPTGNTPPRPAKPPTRPPARGLQETARWQRTVRYGWDKGGAKGGR